MEVASGAKGCLFALVLAGEGGLSLVDVHDGGGEPLVPDCRVRVVFRSVSSKAAASSYGAAGADQRGRNHLRRVHLVIYPPVQTRARAPLAHLHIHIYTYTTPHTYTAYTDQHVHTHMRLLARAHT